MIEKVNPEHPDKIADRIAGALVDLVYSKKEDPKIAVEVLIGHSICHIIAETDTEIKLAEAGRIVKRIAGGHMNTDLVVVPQDESLAGNQEYGIRCGDNGIFKGMPVTREQRELSKIARNIYRSYPTDGKYILAGEDLIICQSNADSLVLQERYPGAYINPIGDWTGGTNVDTGATNRKLGSDMGAAVTGGGLHGKDLSKADVSVNIWCHLQAQKHHHPVEAYCAIGDTEINGIPYEQIVEEARQYIRSVGGFEKFAEWGLI